MSRPEAYPAAQVETNSERESDRRLWPKTRNRPSVGTDVAVHRSVEPTRPDPTRPTLMLVPMECRPGPDQTWRCAGSSRCSEAYRPAASNGAVWRRRSSPPRRAARQTDAAHGSTVDGSVTGSVAASGIGSGCIYDSIREAGKTSLSGDAEHRVPPMKMIKSGPEN